MSWLRPARCVLSAARVGLSAHSRNISCLAVGITRRTDNFTGSNVNFKTLSADRLLQTRSFHISGHFHASVVDISLEDLKKEIQKGELVLIDTRNPPETTSTGSLPSAKLLPLPYFSKAMRMDAEEFEAEYGFSKPKLDDDIAVFCRSGVRAMTAIDALTGLGYQKVRRYKGGWLEWADNHPGLKREPDGTPA